MGIIVQKERGVDIIKDERKPLYVTNWRIIEPFNEGMMVYINDSVFFVHGLTLEELNDINQNNKRVCYWFEYKMASLRCEKCGGTGKVDWVDKATRGKEQSGLTRSNVKVKYVRDRKGIITVLDHYGREAFSSVSKIKTGDEHCYECHGCGIHMGQFRKFDTTSFDGC